jgi:putative transcriptional regulator
VSKINHQLKALRAKHDLSQEEIGELIGMTVTTYNRKENGLREFTLSEAGKLSDLFGVKIEQIFFVDEVTKPITCSA